MLASYFMGADAQQKFELREEVPAVPGAGEVLVRVRACGVCGTDVHIYHGEEGSAPVNPPVVLGHEFSGEVAAIGEGVVSLQVGDHVAMDPNRYCGACRPCRMGKKQNCEHLFALGVNTNGGFEEYALCPADQCFLVNPELPFEAAAMAEPLACAIHGIDRAGIRPGQNVLVVGGGTIGLMMVQLARLSGAAKVVLSEPVKMRQEIGLQLGAAAVIDPIHESIAERLQEIWGTPGADVVIECVGRTFAVEQAIAAAGPGATVLLFSVPAPGSTVPLPLMDVFKKELTIVGSIINPDTHQRAVDLINSGRMELMPLITHRFDLAHLEQAIQMQMSSESIKVMVTP